MDYVRKTLALMGMEKCKPSCVLGNNEKLMRSEQEEETVELDADRGASNVSQLTLTIILGPQYRSLVSSKIL